jgi:hypothetical protein
MADIGIEDGLGAMGYGVQHLDQLVAGTLAQRRITQLAPIFAGRDELAKIFENSMTVYR